MLSKIEKAVVKAGEHLLKGFNSTKEINFKGKIDMVTQYDVQVEEILINELSFMSGDYGFVAEEKHKDKSDKKNVVYIDPIDGTTNFVHGFPFCCISVGVYEEGVGTYGVVYNPVMGELFKAEKDGGAYLNGERLHCSKKESLYDCLIATGFPYSVVEGESTYLMEILAEVLRNTRGIRRVGSAALDLCYVARGVFDAYYEFNLSPWDIAGGAVIASEAGAIICGRDNNSYDLYEKFVLASTPGVSQNLHNIIRKKF